MASFTPVVMNEKRFLTLLEKLIGVASGLQNNPAQGLIPREDLASDLVLEVLRPLSTECGGPLEIKRISFVEGRGNLIVKLPGKGGPSKICSFVGSHLDVVPASADGWSRDPFKLQIDGDMLYGRGTTDCLGHVALLTDFMATLAESKVQLETTIVVIFIANEENSTFVGIGVDQLAKEGHMDELKQGPLFWVDSADSQPCIGTAGMMQWKLEAHGKLFHSGLPHKGINAIEFAMDAVSEIQRRFYKEFPRTEGEDKYNYATCTTMKPCQISCTPGALNQLPPSCTVEGDMRVTPFYSVSVVKAALERWVAEINANPACVENADAHGPHSKYYLADEGKGARLELTWLVAGENGIACNLESKGYRALLDATTKVLGDAKPYSIGGSLPLIRDLQDSGFDVMITGYGLSSKYHADNEAASLKDLKNATCIISNIISGLEDA